MSYESENIIDRKVRLKDVQDFVELLGYKYLGAWNGEELGRIKSYHWFEKNDYKSTNGVELSIYYYKDNLYVTTRTNVSRSYYDLEQQNKTIRLIKKHFGGIKLMRVVGDICNLRVGLLSQLPQVAT